MLRPMRILGTLLAVTLTLGCTAAGPGNDDAADGEGGAQGDPPTPAERLGLTTGWGPTQQELEKAARYAQKLPLRKLAGQVIVAEWSGDSPPLGMVRRLSLGGVIAFSDNVISADQIRSVNRKLQRKVRRPWPLMISVDQEGGRVARVRGDLTRFPAFMSVGAADQEKLTAEVSRASGGELRSLGFNVDFAPVADVTWGVTDVAIGARSAGSRPRAVARHVLAAAEGMVEGGVVPVLKHFPGHGSVGADSHLTLPVQRRSRRQLERIDWRPFRAGVEAGLPAIMVGHLNVRAIHRGVPSSLSKRVVTGALRKKLGFEGLVVTDALNMSAVTDSYGPAKAAVAALHAGADVLLMPPDLAAARKGIIKAVRKGKLERSRLRQAAARQIALLLHHRAEAGEGRPPGSSAALSLRLSATALTSVAGPCRGDIAPDRPIPLGEPVAVANFRLAAERAGLALGSIDYVKPAKPRPPKKPKPKASKKERRSYDKAVRQHQRDLERWRKVKPTPVLRGTRVDLVGAGAATPSGDYVIAVDTPYVLGRSSARVRLATYGDTLGAMTALVAHLQGKAPAPGTLPVPVRGVRRGC